MASKYPSPLLEYKEQKQIIPSNCSLPSICDFPIDPLPADVKEKVLDYMFNDAFRHFYMVGGYSDTDAFTGGPIHTYSTQLNDGTYSWFDNLAMYVLRPDVALPDYFVDHIMSFYRNGGEVTPYFDWRND